MKKIKAVIKALKDLSQEDISNFKTWVWRLRTLNMFEPKVLAAPRTVMCKAETEDGEALLYMPLQPVLMYDAIAPKEGLTPRQEAYSLFKINEAVEHMAKSIGYQELYFICRDDTVSDLCVRNGFTEIKNVRVVKKTIEFSKPSTTQWTGPEEHKAAVCNASQQN